MKNDILKVSNDFKVYFTLFIILRTFLCCNFRMIKKTSHLSHWAAMTRYKHFNHLSYHVITKVYEFITSALRRLFSICLCLFSDPPQLLVTASRALLLKQWDWRQAQCTRSWRAIHTVPVASMTFDSTSTLLATGQQLHDSFCLLCFCHIDMVQFADLVFLF